MEHVGEPNDGGAAEGPRPTHDAEGRVLLHPVYMHNEKYDICDCAGFVLVCDYVICRTIRRALVSRKTSQVILLSVSEVPGLLYNAKWYAQRTDVLDCHRQRPVVATTGRVLSLAS